MWHRAGVPMNDTGITHTHIMENEKLVPKENHLQNCYKIYYDAERAAGRTPKKRADSVKLND